MSAVSFDGVGRGGRGCESERREGQSLACLQCGDREGCGMWSSSGMKLCFGVRDGQ